MPDSVARRSDHIAGSQSFRYQGMIDAIDFLEIVGQGARWRHAAPEALAAALTEAQIDPMLRMAILAGDEQGLQALLGLNPVCCLINPPKLDEDQEECEGSCEEGEGETGTMTRAGMMTKNHTSRLAVSALATTG